MDEQRPPSGPPRQVPLFDDRPKIIPFETITRRRTAARRQGPARRTAPRGEQPPAGEPVAQPPLDLRAAAPLQRKAVNDDALVARPVLRLRAAALDAGFLALGIGTAAVTFRLLGGSFDMASRKPLPWAIAVLAMALFYHLFWCVLGGESAGTRCLGLRLLTFDGHRPGWKRFTARFLLLCCGMVAVGLGPLWALIDEEGLAWHDHISKTFLAEFDPSPSTLRRR